MVVVGKVLFWSPTARRTLLLYPAVTLGFSKPRCAMLAEGNVAGLGDSYSVSAIEEE